MFEALYSNCLVFLRCLSNSVIVGCEGPSTPYRFLTSPLGLSKRDAFSAVTAFAAPKKEAFVQFQTTLSHFFFFLGGESFPTFAFLDGGLGCAHHVSLDGQSHTLLAVVRASTVFVSSHPPRNKKGEETRRRRNIWLFAWLMSSLKTYWHAGTFAAHVFFALCGICCDLFGQPFTLS
uniref:Uncharacterized protein n=1 Tax=Ixodes ricinus TaxID=34613 RepID=A0A6B0UYK6_IXORI